jgi:hypothetical protein
MAEKRGDATFGGRLLRAMQEVGIRKNIALSSAIGVSEGTIRNWLKRADSPQGAERTITVIANLLEIRRDWLTHGTPPMKEGQSPETLIAYRTDTLDGRLLGACIRQVMTALNESQAGEVSDAQLGAVVAEIYKACIETKKPPTHELATPFIRVLLA